MPPQHGEILDELAKLGETRTWEPGTAVVNEGDPADCMYIIHSGELRAVVSGQGGRTMELNTLVAGELFGELMLSGERRSATVEVISRARLTRINRADVERALTSRPELALDLIQRLVQRVRILTHTVGRMALVDVYGRLVGLFETLAVGEAARRVVPGPLSQARIAERVGASKAMTVPPAALHPCSWGTGRSAQVRSKVNGSSAPAAATSSAGTPPPALPEACSGGLGFNLTGTADGVTETVAR